MNTSESKEISKGRIGCKKRRLQICTWNQLDVRMTLNLKDKILEIYRASQKNIRDLEYIGAK